MVNYTLAEDRNIGMIQTDINNNLYSVGCVGRIHSFNETSDGRYLISLQGTNCFKVLRELDTSFSFRIVDVELIKKIDLDSSYFQEKQKQELLGKYENYIKIKKIDLDLLEIEKIDLIQLMKFIAMVSPFKHIEKQALLETFDMKDFYNKLGSILDLESVGEMQNKSIN